MSNLAESSSHALGVLMQDPASFNLDAVKRKVEATIKQHEGE
jgi:hypothetical protein